MSSTTIDWYTVQPQHKWQILKTQKLMCFWVLFVSIGAMMLGFDFGISGTATAIPAFQKQMGEPYPGQASGYLIPARYQAGWTGATAG
ncbi:hypothetical protein LTR93_012369, partial [Exophiala xenobiotica]